MAICWWAASPGSGLFQHPFMLCSQFLINTFFCLPCQAGVLRPGPTPVTGEGLFSWLGERVPLPAESSLPLPGQTRTPATWRTSPSGMHGMWSSAERIHLDKIPRITLAEFSRIRNYIEWILNFNYFKLSELGSSPYSPTRICIGPLFNMVRNKNQLRWRK